MTAYRVLQRGQSFVEGACPAYEEVGKALAHSARAAMLVVLEGEPAIIAGATYVVVPEFHWAEFTTEVETQMKLKVSTKEAA